MNPKTKHRINLVMYRLLRFLVVLCGLLTAIFMGTAVYFGVWTDLSGREFFWGGLQMFLMLLFALFLLKTLRKILDDYEKSKDKAAEDDRPEEDGWPK